jgi:AcrR family transcriptional regulator
VQVIDKPAKQATEIRQAGLVEAALALAAQRSPASITTTDLATAVGISQGAVFRHFASKEAIWLAVMDWVNVTLMARLHEVAGQNQLEPMLALEGVFMAHVDFVMAYPGVPRVIFQELQSPDDTALKAGVRRLMQHYRQLLMGLLTQAQADGALSRHLDLPAAAVLFIGSIQGLVMQSLISGQVAGMAQLAPGVYAIFQRGLQAESLS